MHVNRWATGATDPIQRHSAGSTCNTQTPCVYTADIRWSRCHFHTNTPIIYCGLSQLALMTFLPLLKKPPGVSRSTLFYSVKHSFSFEWNHIRDMTNVVLPFWDAPVVHTCAHHFNTLVNPIIPLGLWRLQLTQRYLRDHSALPDKGPESSIVDTVVFPNDYFPGAYHNLNNVPLS